MIDQTALSRVCYAALTRTGVPAASRRLRRSGVILCYHNVVAASQGGVTGDPAVHLALARFEEQMQWLRGHYDVVGLSELLERLATGRSVAHLAVLTFDDAYGGVFANAVPVLERLALPATVFVVAEGPDRGEPFWWDRSTAVAAGPSARERWIDALAGDERRIAREAGFAAHEQVAPTLLPASWPTLATAIRSGMLDVGAHSATHRNLTRISDAELARELVTSRETIAARTGVRPAFFAYPYGLWNDRVREVARLAGYRGAVSLDYGLVGRGADPWALRRVNVPASISSAAFEAWVSGLRARPAQG